MLDVKDDKSLWEKMSLKDVGKVLLVEESYYDGIIDDIEGLKAEVSKLKEIISHCRCEECGNELGENWVDDDGVVCGDCYGNREDY